MSPEQADLLAGAVQSGHRDAFRDLYQGFYADLSLFVARRAVDREMADEVVQATFVTAFESMRTYELRGTFSAWLRGIALNRLSEERRRRARSIPVDLATIESALTPAPDETPAGGADDGLIARLTRCLDRLGPEARALILERYASGLQVQQLAAARARTAASLSVSLCRIRQSLRTCLESGDG